MDVVREIRWTKYLISLVYIVLGAIIIAKPDIVGEGFCVILAITLAVMGLASILAYLMTKVDERVAASNNGLAYGIILCLLAVFIMMQQHLVISLIPFILGLMIAVRGIMMIQHTINLHRFGVQGLMANMILAILVIIFGVVIMLFPFEMATGFFIAMGIGLVFSGVVDIVDNFLLGRELKKFRELEGAAIQSVIDAQKAKEAN